MTKSRGFSMVTMTENMVLAYLISSQSDPVSSKGVGDRHWFTTIIRVGTAGDGVGEQHQVAVLFHL